MLGSDQDPDLTFSVSINRNGCACWFATNAIWVDCAQRSSVYSKRPASRYNVDNAITVGIDKGMVVGKYVHVNLRQQCAID